MKRNNIINDLGKYELEFDYENNCVELIKV